MYKRTLLFVFSFVYFVEIFSFINPKPICMVYTPDSILLHNKKKYKPLYFGKRLRYGTCTATTWFHDDYIASLHLLSERIITYRFDRETHSFTILQQMSNKDGLQVRQPEHLIVSPDGNLLVVCGYSHINVYSIDHNTHLINPKPILKLPSAGIVHNIRFTNDGSYLGCVVYSPKQSICTYKVIPQTDTISLKRVCTLPRQFELIKAKGINFTYNDRFILISHGLSLGGTHQYPFQGITATYRFNQDGSIGECVCKVKMAFTPEDIVLTDNKTIVISSQGDDKLYIFPFDSETGQIDSNYTVLENPEAQLSFPHGMGLSEDGNYLTVANYGDDKFNLYKVE